MCPEIQPNVINLPYNWTPRAYQEPLWFALESGIKRAFLFWHRRAGKDLTMLNRIACCSMQTVGAYWHVFPTYKQGRRIAWEGRTKDGRRFVDHFPKEIISRIRDQEMTIDFINGSSYQIVGADNPDSQVGTNPVGMVFSEFAVLESDDIWILLQPILAENDGWAIFITTPRGRNHAYRMYQKFKDDPTWFCEVLSYKDTGAITEEAVARAIREGMSVSMAAQEFECSFNAALEHAFYGEEMKKASDEGRIGLYPHLEDFPVETWWDIGMDNRTAIWFVQKHQGALRIIDYVEGQNKGHPHWMTVLGEKMNRLHYNYSEHLLPHDVNVNEWGTETTRIERFYNAGIHNVRAVAKIGKMDGIDAVKATLGRCYFHEPNLVGEGQEGLESLRQYVRKPLVGQFTPDNQQIYSDEALKNWATDGADAFRTGVVGSRPVRFEAGEKMDLSAEIAIV